VDYTPDRFVGESGYKEEGGQVPDNSEIIDVKKVAIEFRRNVEDMDKSNIEHTHYDDGPQPAYDQY
jgi:hypothetical protein